VESAGLTRGETQGTGISEQYYNQQTLFGSTPYDVTVYRSHGRSGATLSEIEKPRPPYQIGIEEARHTKNLGADLGWQTRVAALFITHGTADRTDGTNATSYSVGLLNLMSNYDTDLRYVTGQEEPVRFFIDQLAPARNDGLQGVIPEAQISAANSYDYAYVTGPKYQYPYVDDVHLTDVGYRRLGELHGFILNKVLHNGVDWKPLQPSNISRDGTVITVDFDVPYEPIVLDDTTLGAATDYGFSVYDDAVKMTISSVVVTGASQIQITVSTAPTGAEQRLKFVEGDVGYLVGNVRDSMALQTLYDSTNLYNWLVCFDRVIP
jgi:hypothetical protein